jgi:hypothetical protein
MSSEEPREEPPRSYRLGDDVEDHCTRCRGISMHAVSAILNNEIVKVLCRACLGEHKYRHGKGRGKELKEKARKKLFDDVLKSSPFYKPEE